MSGTFLWYATRGAGLVSIVLFTAVVCLGILTVGRWGRPGWPRFLTAEFHRNLALLALAFLTIHILVAVFDPFTSLGLTAALIPFSSPYRQFWLGLGVVALYLIVAIVATSLLRTHLGHRTWRAIHWLSYAAWPIAVAHGLGTGSDTGALWAWLLNGACVVAVGGAIAWRIQATSAARVEIEGALPAAARRDRPR